MAPKKKVVRKRKPSVRPLVNQNQRNQQLQRVTVNLGNVKPKARRRRQGAVPVRQPTSNIVNVSPSFASTPMFAPASNPAISSSAGFGLSPPDTAGLGTPIRVESQFAVPNFGEEMIGVPIRVSPPRSIIAPPLSLSSASVSPLRNREPSPTMMINELFSEPESTFQMVLREPPSRDTPFDVNDLSSIGSADVLFSNKLDEDLSAFSRGDIAPAPRSVINLIGGAKRGERATAGRRMPPISETQRVPTSYERMTVSQLKAVAKNMGVETTTTGARGQPKNRKKSDIIADLINL